MRLAGTGTNDPKWLEKLLRYPPTSLSTLEYWVGTVDVDFAGAEGYGQVSRPHASRGKLRPELTELHAWFWERPYGGRHTQGDMTLKSFTLALDVAHVTVAQLLAKFHGPGRAIATEHGEVIEHVIKAEVRPDNPPAGWFYLRLAPNGSARLTLETTREEWAIPPPPTGARDDLLHTLHDRLICETEPEPIYEALKPLAAAANAELRDSNRGPIDLSFRPAQPLADVLAALRWENTVTRSFDVHNSVWHVFPRDVPLETPHINVWQVDVRLDGWPKGEGGIDLPRIGREGPSPLYDARTCVNDVVGISIKKPR